MTDAQLTAILWTLLALLALIVSLSILEGIYAILYRFIAPFRRAMDRFYASLPKWDE